MNYDEIFFAIDELYEKKKTDDILVELTEAFYKAAFEYTRMIVFEHLNIIPFWITIWC